jgi:hypothetical protein
MSKIKMRCITCGKWFQSANAKEVTCHDCTQKARKEKLASKNTPPAINKPVGSNGPSTMNRPAAPPPPKPKPAHGGTSQWLDTLDDVKVGQPDQPTRPKIPSSPASRDNLGGPGGYRGPTGPGGYHDNDRGPGGYREGDRGPGAYREGGRGPGAYREGGRGPGAYRESDRGPGGYREGDRGPGAYREGGRGPGGYRVGGGSGITGTFGPRPRQPAEGGFGRGPNERGPRPGGPGGPKGKGRPPRPAAPPKPKKEKTPPPAPFTPTPEQAAQVEIRYTELATPIEFDGIRTQIAKELNIPKKAVKKIVKELRDRQHIPSWWEAQTYKGSAEELEKIKSLYEPFLPVPPVGVHKQIAEQLNFKPGEVYQAIKTVRQELNLPQYNDPALHEEELALIRQAREEQRAAAEAARAEAAKAKAEAATAADKTDVTDSADKAEATDKAEAASKTETASTEEKAPDETPTSPEPEQPPVEVTATVVAEQPASTTPATESNPEAAG